MVSDKEFEKNLDRYSNTRRKFWRLRMAWVGIGPELAWLRQEWVEALYNRLGHQSKP